MNSTAKLAKFTFDKLVIPVIQAPMAGGYNTPALCAAVANAGGVGSFGFAYSSPEYIDTTLAATSLLTDGPINANFFIFKHVDPPTAEEQQSAIDSLRHKLGNYVTDIDLKVPQKPPYFPDLHLQLEPIWKRVPSILTFHFGIPPIEVMEKAKVLNIAVGITATCLQEALEISAAGADFIVAQGIEAGGHRGNFDADAADQNLCVDDLVKSIASHTHLPIVAAGGIMNGGDIYAKLKLGAASVQMGTAFLCTTEAGTSSLHRKYILQEQFRGTAFTRAFSGRRAQGIENTFIRSMKDQPYLQFPIQNALTGPIRQRAVADNNGEYQAFWAGQAYAKTRVTSAKDLMSVLSDELAVAAGTARLD